MDCKDEERVSDSNAASCGKRKKCLENQNYPFLCGTSLIVIAVIQKPHLLNEFKIMYAVKLGWQISSTQINVRIVITS